MQLTAITADSHWQSALQNATTVTIDSIFHRAINLRLDTGELLSIFPVDSPNFPNGLVASHQIGQTLGRVGEKGQLSATGIVFECTTITTDSCQFINHSLNETLLPLPSPECLEQFKRRVQTQARAGSFYGAMANDAFNEAQVRWLERARAQLKQAFMTGSTKDIANATKQLIGLGIGLTPSGDDYLLGLLLVLNHSAKTGSAILQAIHQGILDNLDTTTSISQTYLRAGLECCYGELLRNLVIALTKQTAALKVETTLQALLAHGATSGQDTCTGMMDAWEFLYQ